MKHHLFSLPLVLLLILTGHMSACSASAIQVGEDFDQGLYIGRHLEFLNEKDLFLILSGEWKVEPVYIEKMLSGELHSDGNMIFRVNHASQGYEARMEIMNTPQSIRVVRWGIEDLRRHEAYLKFKPIERSIPFLNFMPHSYWLRFQVQNNETSGIGLCLELDKHLFSILDLFYRTETGWKINRGDFIQNLNERSLPHRNLAFLFKADPGLNTYYLRVDSWLVDNVPLRIWTKDGFARHKVLDDTFQKVLIGIFLFIFAFNLFVYFIIRDISYLLLSLMTISGLVIHLAFSGVGFEFFWPKNSLIGLSVLIYAIPLSYMVSLQFSRAFIDTRLNTPGIDRIIRYVIWFLVALILLYIVLPASLAKMILALNLLLEYLFYLPVLIAAVKVTRSGNRSGVFLLIGIFMHYLSLLEWFLTSFDIIPYQFINYIHIKGASFLIILTLGLTHKIKTMQKSLTDLQQNRRQKPVTDTTRAKIQSIQNYLTENYAENLTRERLAEIAGISPDHLSRMFKQETGERISDFVNKIRIEKATKLLLESDEKVIAIAYEVGFGSLRTFNKVFLEITGRTPSEHRKQARGNPVQTDVK
ncbi:helix-turn-helix domain-containing protein [bacterium]|nr:helix-turn-helix domain-containing protein [bacterium]